MKLQSSTDLTSAAATAMQHSALDEARAAAVRAYLRWRGKIPLSFESYRFFRDERGLTRSTLERTISMMAARGEVKVTEHGGYVTVRLAEGDTE